MTHEISRTPATDPIPAKAVSVSVVRRAPYAQPFFMLLEAHAHPPTPLHYTCPVPFTELLLYSPDGTQGIGGLGHGRRSHPEGSDQQEGVNRHESTTCFRCRHRRNQRRSTIRGDEAFLPHHHHTGPLHHLLPLPTGPDNQRVASRLQSLDVQNNGLGRDRARGRLLPTQCSRRLFFATGQ